MILPVNLYYKYTIFSIKNKPAANHALKKILKCLFFIGQNSVTYI